MCTDEDRIDCLRRFERQGSFLAPQATHAISSSVHICAYLRIISHNETNLKRENSSLFQARDHRIRRFFRRQ